MEKKKKIFLTIFSIVLLFSLSACNSDKDEASSLANSFNNWLQSFSKYAVAKDKNLQGERLTGIDSYTGNYEAKYNDFDGEEIIFGGTALNRDSGNDLNVSYILEVTSGTAALYWAERTEEHIIAEVNGKDTYEIKLDLGDNYIGLKGNDFTGSLELKVE